MILRFCGTTMQSTSVRQLIKSLSEQIQRAYTTFTTVKRQKIKKLLGWSIDEKAPSNYKELVAYFHSMLSRATKDKPLLIFLDSLDQLDDSDQGRKQLVWLPKSLPPHCYFVVSTLPDIGGCLQSLRATDIPRTNYLEVTELSVSEADGILNSWLQDINRTLTTEQHKAILKYATDGSTEKPTTLRLRLLFDIASQWCSYTKYQRLPNNVPHLIERFFENVEEIHGKKLVSTVFGLLATSRNGLSETDLIDILSSDEDVLDSVLQYHKPPIRRVPYMIIARLKNDLGPYMVDRGAYGKTVLAWYHRQFWEAASKRYIPSSPFSEERSQFAHLIADYFADRARNEFPDRGLTPQPLYWKTDDGLKCLFNQSKLGEYPSALCVAGRIAEFSKEVCNLQFIAALCSVGFGRNLLNSFYAIHTSIQNEKNVQENDVKERINSYSVFLKLNIHILEDYPHLVRQLALNDLDSSLVCQDALKDENPTPWIPKEDQLVEVRHVNKLKSQNPCVMTLRGHQSATLEIKTFGQYVITAFREGVLSVWYAITGENILMYEAESNISAMDLHAQSSEMHVVFSCLNGKVYVWSIEVPDVSNPCNLNGKITCSWQAYQGAVDKLPIALAQTSGLVVTGVCCKTKQNKVYGEVTLWKLQNNENNYPENVECLVSPRDVDSLAPGGYHAGNVGIGCLVFSPNEEYIVASVGCDGHWHHKANKMIAVCSAQTLDPLWFWHNKLHMPLSIRVYDLEFKAESKVQLWGILVATTFSMTLMAFHSRSEGIVCKVLWSVTVADGLRFAVLTEDRGFAISVHLEKISLWKTPDVVIENPETWGADFQMIENESPIEINSSDARGSLCTAVNICKLSSKNEPKTHVLTGTDLGLVKVWQLDLLPHYKLPPTHTFKVCSSALSPNNKWLATGSDLGTGRYADIKVWDPCTGELLGSTQRFAYRIVAMAFSPNNDWFCFRMNTYPVIHFWEVQRFKQEEIPHKVTDSGFQVLSIGLFISAHFLTTGGQE